MTQRLRSDMYSNISHTDLKSKKMGDDLGTGKTVFILVIVVGCFAILCPNVFYPMLFGSPQNRIKPSPIDRTTGCCDVISETDVNTIRIMSELCSTIIKRKNDTQLSGREIISQCQKAVLETCGIDISAVLQERVILGHTTKQILDEIRSLNGSLCLKYNFGVSPWRLGVPHRVTVNVEPSPSIRQERPSHIRSEMLHPAFKERGRAIPAQQLSPSRPAPRIVEGKPGPLPGMRPTLGGAGKVVPPPKQTTGTMGLIMPVYTAGIVILFTYTVMKILFKKQQSESLYPPVEPDPVFRRDVFEANRGHSPMYAREPSSNKLGDIELDQLRRRLRETEAAMERIVEQMAKVPLKMQDIAANGKLVDQEDQGSVKVLGMEMTASCEGNKKWTGLDSLVLPSTPTIHPIPTQPPHEIYLEGSLPPQSNHLLVTDSATEAQKLSTEEDPAVVLAGKMTLSVLSLDSDNGTEELHFDKKSEERSSSNVSEDFEKIDSRELLEDPLNEVSSFENANGEKASNEIPATVTEALKEISEPTDNLVYKTEKDLCGHEVNSTTINSAKISPLADTYCSENEIQKFEETITDIADFSENADIEIQSNRNKEDQVEAKEVAGNIDGIMQIIGETVNSKSIENDLNKIENTGIRQKLKDESIINNKEKQDQIQLLSDEINLDTVSTNPHIETLSDSSNDLKKEDIIEPSGIHPEIIEIEDEQKNKETSSTTDNDLVIELSTDVSSSGLARRHDHSSSNEFQKVIDNGDDENEENIENHEEEEYEYDISDDADVDEEIQNVERLDNMPKSGNTRMNGTDHEQLQDDTYEENLGSDEEVEEIIEYVTEEEEEEELTEDEVQYHNNVNNLAYNFPDSN